MGSGKTEAALTAVYELIADDHAAGLFFALPTQVTSNRVYERVAAFLAQADAEPDNRRLRLAHSTSWLQEEQLPPTLHPAIPMDGESANHAVAGRSWFASSKRALLAPYGVGTIDQALLGVVAAKHFFVRQFGLAGKVVILDEVHTYDLYTGTLLDVLIKCLRELHCTVIILSATLTAARRRELIALSGSTPSTLDDAYPLLTACTENKPPQAISFVAEVPKSISVETTTVATVEVAKQVLSRASASQCVLWVRNTVREAQETFRIVRNSNREGGPSVALLHSRFPQFRRDQLESLWLRRLGKDGDARPAGCIMVATQVVEQSVDIDADFLVTDLAPTDMLLQRLGRLWRHERTRPPDLTPKFLIHVPVALCSLDLQQAGARQLKEALGPGARVYAPYVLLRSLAEWCRRSQVMLPNHIRPLIEATYQNFADEPVGWRELRHELEHSKEKLRQLALSNTNVWNQPALADDEGVQTQFNSQPSAQLLLANLVEPAGKGCNAVSLLSGESIEVKSHDWSIAAAKAIHWNLARIPRYAVMAGLYTAPGWLRVHVSGECALGLVRDGNIFWPDSDAPSGLTWHTDEGVTIAQQCQNTASPSLEEGYESYD
jgi:CRISPR-associated endonuclease/helicase Cas3